ncbi:MAG: tetratricopeptide repeat protein, partial [Treponema sp.]|nr:tetratricopeptide repeat protein [Treponema sp.]
NPSFFLTYTYLAGLYDEQNKYEEELEQYKKVIEVNPDYYFAYEALGMLYWHKEQWINSRNSFLKAFEYNSKFHAANENYPLNVSYPLMIAATYLKQNNSAMCKKYLATVRKNFTSSTIESNMLRLYNDLGPVNLETSIVRAINDEKNKTTKGKMLYYMGLYYEIKNSETLAKDFYVQVQNMNTPMFFEYRLADWSLGNESN